MEMKNNNEEKSGIAPFVMKTYQLVNSPSTDSVVVWGIQNNSFIILDPMCFSQRILPAYFKHNNFSSFVRQLNTYGFRKVDPDRWEFANQWFLRGQEHLLSNITRKKYYKNVTYKRTELEMDEQQLRGEVSRLKEEQRQLEEELHHMSRRIEAAERRPDQIMTLLCTVVQDPQLFINGTLLDKGTEQLALGEEKKKRRTVKPSGSSSSTSGSFNNSSSMAVSTSNKSEAEDDRAVGCGGGVINSSTTTTINNKLVYCDNGFDNNLVVFDSFSTAPISYDKAAVTAAAEVADDGGGHSPPPRRQIPYPFSLLEGGF